MYIVSMLVIWIVVIIRKYDKELVMDIKKEEEIKIFFCNFIINYLVFKLYVFFLKLVINYGDGYWLSYKIWVNEKEYIFEIDMMYFF